MSAAPVSSNPSTPPVRAGLGFLRGLREGWRDFSAALRPGEISLFHDFSPPPAGGGHQFLRGLRGEWVRRGIRVETNTLSPGVRACLFNSFNFDFARLRRLAARRSSCRFVHRVDGPVQVYRSHDDGTDRRLWEINQQIAHATIFQSEYSRARHAELGLACRNPVVISNAVDPAVFHPPAQPRAPLPGRRLRLIASSWSMNPNKGADVYEWLDRNLDFLRVEMSFVGRCATSFQNIRLLPPVDSHGLAQALRGADAFVFPSRHESCSNALLEALACGLPALFVRSGSNAELAGEGGLGFLEAGELPGLIDRLSADIEGFRARIRLPALTEIARRYLEVLRA